MHSYSILISFRVQSAVVKTPSSEDMIDGTWAYWSPRALYSWAYWSPRALVRIGPRVHFGVFVEGSGFRSIQNEYFYVTEFA